MRARSTKSRTRLQSAAVLLIGMSSIAAGITDVAAQGQDGLRVRQQDPEVRRELERRVEVLWQQRVARGGGQPDGQLPADPLEGPVVQNAPFSADATTTVTQVLGDGTRIEQSTTSKFYRDRAGRVRREQTVLGLDALNPGRAAQTVITISPTPGDATAYALDPVARTARAVPRVTGAYFRLNTGAVITYGNGISTLSLANSLNSAPGGSPTLVDAGTRNQTIEGLPAVCRTRKGTIPVGEIGNDRAIEITDERCESRDLQVLLSSRYSDPRTAVIEYRLMNVTRAEPPPDLFVIPPDYTIVQGGGRRGGPTPAAPRTGGGGRGRQPQ
jgi:hypothetical protein